MPPPDPQPPDDNSRGIRCPHCGCGHNKVTHTTPYDFLYANKLIRTTRRRHLCRYCRLSFTTVQHLEDENNLGMPDPTASPPEPTPFTAPYPTIDPESPNPPLPHPVSLPPKKNPYL